MGALLFSWRLGPMGRCLERLALPGVMGSSLQPPKHLVIGLFDESAPRTCLTPALNLAACAAVNERSR
jgi:hypothetical protein